jgi:hypothetical protein
MPPVLHESVSGTGRRIAFRKAGHPTVHFIKYPWILAMPVPLDLPGKVQLPVSTGASSLTTNWLQSERLAMILCRGNICLQIHVTQA